MGSRVYDPALRQFIQPDALDPMTYTYAGGDPVNHVDPSGLFPVSVETRERAIVATSGHVFGIQKLGALPGGGMRAQTAVEDEPPVHQDGGSGSYDPARDGPIDEWIPVEGRRRGGGVDYYDPSPGDIGPGNDGPRNADGGGGGGGRQGAGSKQPARPPYTAADGAKAIGIATTGIKIGLDGVGLLLRPALPFTKPTGWFIGAIGFLWAVGYQPPTFPADSGVLEGP